MLQSPFCLCVTFKLSRNIKLVFNHALDHHCFTLHEYTENKTHTQTNTHNHNRKRDRNNDTMDNNRYNKKKILCLPCAWYANSVMWCAYSIFFERQVYTRKAERDSEKKDKIRSAVTPTHAKKRSVVDGKPCSAHQYTRTVPVAFRSLDVVVWAKKKRPLTRLVQY